MDNEEDIILDVMLCEWAPHKHGYDVSKNAMTNFENARNERDFYMDTNSLQAALAAYPNVEKRYYFTGSGYHGCYVPNDLDFNNSTTWCLQEAGRQDAKDALQIG